MTTNLKSIAGTDFDDLFEAGAGNQLLNIYAMDGQDVGQKYLNVSQGSQVSANTGFQASDSADVKTKLCGKGLAIISYSFYYGYNFRMYLTLSGIPSGRSVSVNGYVLSEYDDTSVEDFVPYDHRTDFATTFTSDKNGVQTFLVEAHREAWDNFYTFYAELRYGAKSTQVRPPNNRWWYKQTVSGSF